MKVSEKLYSSKTHKQLKEVPEKKGLSTGIQKLDEYFGFPSGFYVICGNPGTGKGWFALWLSRIFWSYHHKMSVFFSLEMPEFAVRKRILQAWSDLTYGEYLKNGDVNPALDLLSEDMFLTDTFYDDDQKQQTPENFEKHFEAYYEAGYRIFHFDHLHEIGGANDNNKNQFVTEAWANMFQKLSKKYPDAWLFVFVQPNGASAKKKILRRTDISGSKAITQKCDFFLSLNRKIQINDDGYIAVDDEDREIIIFLDKSRYTERTHIGFKVIFSPTGNFEDSIQNWLT